MRHKDFVYVAGSFNNWQPTAAYHEKDPASTKFWLELTGFSHSCYVYVLGGRPIAYGRNAFFSEKLILILL
jgi:hypothetical protein